MHLWIMNDIDDIMGTVASTTSSPKNNFVSNEAVGKILTSGYYQTPTTSSNVTETVKTITDTISHNAQTISDVVIDQTISLNELKKLLSKLNFKSDQIETKTKLFQENVHLQDMMQLATQVVVNFSDTKGLDYNVLSQDLKALDATFHELQTKDRKLIGDFLACIMFTKRSLQLYKHILKALEFDHFDDQLLQDFSGQDHQAMIVYVIRSLWWNFSDVSFDFCSSLAEDRILEELVKDLKKMIGKDEKQLKYSFCFESCMGVLHNSAKVENLRSLYRKYKVVNILGKFLIYENLVKVTMLVLITLALIIDENQTHLLTSNESVFDFILKLTKKSFDCKDHRYEGFSTVELLISLSKLSRNDDVKKILVQKKILDLVLSILRNGESEEIEWAAKLLWELSFALENKTKILENESLMSIVQTLSTHTNHQISKACQGVILSIGREKSSTNKCQQGHIMFSYRWSDQKTVVQISDALKTHGYKVWIDIENILGSSVQAMAEAVENCEVFLMCMSEQYKESTNCRAEADYAFKMEKPIIPLLMQNKYKPDGWLGFLLGTKIFYEFTGKYKFEDKLTDLLRDIGDRGKIKKTTENNMMVVPFCPQPLALVNPILDVQEWISQNNLSDLSCLNRLSGQHLIFLKNISFRAPEFYYNFITDFLNGNTSVEKLNSLMLVHNAIEKIKL